MRATRTDGAWRLMSGWYYRRPTKRHPVAVVVVFWTIVRAVQLGVLGWGTGSDPEWFLHYAQQWLAGSAYAAAQPEYPPGAFPIFLCPLLVAGAAGYRQMFAFEMACFDLAACVLVLKCAALRAGESVRAVRASVLYTLMTTALYPVLYTRFDLVPATLVLAAMYCLHRRRLPASAMLLGVAGAVKLWPFAFVPMWLGWAARNGGKRTVVIVSLAIATGALLASLPVLPLARSNALSFFGFYAARGIQVESTWATLALVLANLGLTSVRSTFDFGAFQVAGRVPSALAMVSTPFVVLLALLPQMLAIAPQLRRGGQVEQNDRPYARSFDYAVLAGTIGLLIGGKVLSPQFMLWIAPLLALTADGPSDVVFVLAIGALTTVVYPYLSPALEQRAPGHAWALVAVLSRNLILVGWYCVALRRESALFGPIRPHTMNRHANG
jgi:hypothetical protein